MNDMEQLFVLIADLFLWPIAIGVLILPLLGVVILTYFFVRKKFDRFDLIASTLVAFGVGFIGVRLVAGSGFTSMLNPVMI